MNLGEEGRPDGNHHGDWELEELGTKSWSRIRAVRGCLGGGEGAHLRRGTVLAYTWGRPAHGRRTAGRTGG
jgi:hypothetical protein